MFHATSRHLVVATVLCTAAVTACTDPGSPLPIETPAASVAPLTSRSEAFTPAGPSSGATVSIVHGINGTDLKLPLALPVDVEVNGACPVRGLVFREIRGPLALPAGVYTIKVRLAGGAPCSGTAVITVNGARLNDGENVSIVAHLSAAGAPTASVFLNDLSGGRQAAIAARHTAAFGPVDVGAGGSRVFTGVPNGAGGTRSIVASTIRVNIFPAGSSPAAATVRLPLPAGFLTVFYAVGTPANGTLEILVQQLRLAPNTTSRISVIHGINGRDLSLVEALPVDIELNGQCVLPGFTFRTVTPPLSIPSGVYNVAVKLAAGVPCSGAAVIQANGVTFERGISYSIVAHLTATGKPTASVFGDRLESGFDGATVAARHTAAFGPVDVLVGGAVAFAGVTNGSGGRAALPAGPTDIAIAPAGTSTPVFAARPNLFAGGVVNAFYAVGTPANGTFEVLAQRVQIQ